MYSQEDVAGFHPGLLSGLVLAGANRPVDFDHDDGILTALEVEALDLSGVELAGSPRARLGLGQSTASEGLLGLQTRQLFRRRELEASWPDCGRCPIGIHKC